LRALRRSRWKAALLDVAAWTGTGSAAIHAMQSGAAWRPSPTAKVKEVDSFGSWADEVWDASQALYDLAAVRDTTTLRNLYPSGGRFHCLHVGAAGWAVVVDTNMRDDSYFGNLRVGTIADCFAQPQDAGIVIRAARLYLADRGVDLIISNQAHAAWTRALRADGFLSGPSNFVFATSPQLSKLGTPGPRTHVNRGDGDGPVHL